MAVVDTQCRVVLLVCAFDCHDCQNSEGDHLRQNKLLPLLVSSGTSKALESKSLEASNKPSEHESDYHQPGKEIKFHSPSSRKYVRLASIYELTTRTCFMVYTFRLIRYQGQSWMLRITRFVDIVISPSLRQPTVRTGVGDMEAVAASFLS